MNREVRLFTIGFTQKTAEEFFSTLRDSNIKTLIDTRINPNSQLSAFAKANDLPFLLKEICNIDYHYERLLAPSKDLLSRFRKKVIDWDEYAYSYVGLLEERNVPSALNTELFRNGVLLCSEATPERCHRRLACEYLQQHWERVSITHL